MDEEKKAQFPAQDVRKLLSSKGDLAVHPKSTPIAVWLGLDTEYAIRRGAQIDSVLIVASVPLNERNCIAYELRKIRVLRRQISEAMQSLKSIHREIINDVRAFFDVHEIGGYSKICLAECAAKELRSLYSIVQFIQFELRRLEYVSLTNQPDFMRVLFANRAQIKLINDLKKFELDGPPAAYLNKSPSEVIAVTVQHINERNTHHCLSVQQQTTHRITKEERALTAGGFGLGVQKLATQYWQQRAEHSNRKFRVWCRTRGDKIGFMPIMSVWVHGRHGPHSTELSCRRAFITWCGAELDAAWMCGQADMLRLRRYSVVDGIARLTVVDYPDGWRIAEPKDLNPRKDFFPVGHKYQGMSVYGDQDTLSQWYCREPKCSAGYFSNQVHSHHYACPCGRRRRVPTFMAPERLYSPTRMSHAKYCRLRTDAKKQDESWNPKRHPLMLKRAVEICEMTLKKLRKMTNKECNMAHFNLFEAMESGNYEYEDLYITAIERVYLARGFALDDVPLIRGQYGP
jgi:hypothetical protein